MEAHSPTDILLFERFHLDRRGLFRRDEGAALAPVEIGSRALDVLGVLLERPGDLLSRDEIMVAAWPGTVVEDNNLTVQISTLRRILDQGRKQGSCIQTVPGRGYRLIVPVTRVERGASPVSAPSYGNGGNWPIAEKEQVQGATAQGSLGRTARAPTSRVRYRLWCGILAALIVALVLIAAFATGNSHSPWSGDARPAPRLSIVVLPFANLSDDRDQQYFADGITEDVTTDLSRITDMFVIARNTAFTYRNKPVDAKQIGRELGVRYVLEGSVRRSGDQLRVTAQLIDAATNAHLWAERFDRYTGDLFALQNEITGRIANALNVELIGAEAAQPAENPDTLDYILRGRAAWNKGPTRDNYVQAIRLFERALALDPGSVDAQTWLANALVTRVNGGLADLATVDIASAEALVGQVLAASPRSALAHWVKAQVLRAQGRCDAAIPEYQTAIALNHNLVGAYANLGWCKFVVTGSIEELISLQEQAIGLSRYDSFIGYWYGRMGFAHLLQSHTDEAIIWFEKAASANPGLWDTHCGLAAAYALKGDLDRAAAELAEARRLRLDGRYSSIARLKATGVLGMREDSMVPKIRALFETTYLAGLRKAGMPEE